MSVILITVPGTPITRRLTCPDAAHALARSLSTQHGKATSTRSIEGRGRITSFYVRGVLAP